MVKALRVIRDHDHCLAKPAVVEHRLMPFFPMPEHDPRGVPIHHQSHPVLAIHDRGHGGQQGWRRGRRGEMDQEAHPSGQQASE
jgi:hypothetical protein